jgi:hypothetical protein
LAACHYPLADTGAPALVSVDAGEALEPNEPATSEIGA